MATEIAFSDLNSWLQAQPANTVSTPYELNVTGLAESNLRGSSYQNTLGYVLNNNNTKYVDLSETFLPDNITSLRTTFDQCASLVVSPNIPNTVENMDGTFQSCTSLKTITNLPDSVTTMEGTFYNCSSLIEISNIPSSVTNLDMAFYNCTSLTTLKQKQFDSSNIIHFSGIFKNCTNLKTFYSDTPYELKIWLSTIYSNTPDNFPTSPNNCTFTLYSYPCEIPFYDETSDEYVLNNELSALSANTVSTPYKIKIIGLGRVGAIEPSSQDYSLGDILQRNNTKYVDLSETIIPNNIDSALACFQNCSSLVCAPEFSTETLSDISHTFDGCTSLTSIPNFPPTSTLTATFKGCTSLTTVPAIQLKGEGNYCDISKVFEGCTSLTSVEIVIGDDISILDMRSAFSGCTALQSFKVKEFTKRNSISNDHNVFENCTNLLNFYSNYPYELKKWLTYLRNSSTNNFPNNINNCRFYLYSTDYVNMHITALSNELSALTANTVSTPFKIKITGLTDGGSGTDIIDLNSILLANLTKYVDLKETVIPNGIMIFGSIYKDCTNLIKAPNNIPNSVVSMSQAFSGCTNLVEAPPLPNNVTNLIDAFNGCSSLTTAPVIPASVEGMTNTFKNCTSLTEAPVIPENVDIMIGTFEGCTSLETVPNVPANVTTLTDCFKNCSSLEEIEVFEVPTSVLKTSAADCFSGCTSLTKVGIPAVENPEASDWHIALLEFGATTVKGKFYDRQGNSVTIPETTITKNKLKLPVLTDELMFNTQTSFADLESLIEDVLQYNYGYYNKFVVTPKNKQFVLYANDPVNGFTTNLPFGGGTQAFDLCYPIGCTYTQYPKQKSPVELWGAISVWEILDYGGAYFRSEGGEALSFDTNVMAIASMSGSNITITNHNAEVGTIIYDFTNNESRKVASISGNVITLDSPFTDATTLRDVLIGQPQSLPNIRASVSCDSEGLFNGRGSIRTSGAFSVSGGNKYCGGDNGDSGRPNALSFNAQSAEPTYGRRNEVSPNAFTKVVWVRTA